MPGLPGEEVERVRGSGEGRSAMAERRWRAEVKGGKRKGRRRMGWDDGMVVKCWDARTWIRY